jgi:hypothetical protein
MIKYKWLLIYTYGESYEKRRGGINRKNKPPYHIIATKKNKEIIAQYYNIETEADINSRARKKSKSNRKKK